MDPKTVEKLVKGTFTLVGLAIGGACKKYGPKILKKSGEIIKSLSRGR